MTQAADIAPTVDLSDPQYYFNRELSWLEFNDRVLHEAIDPRTPFLERLKFVAIFSANLDEFFYGAGVGADGANQCRGEN